jgi:hypothetical protein
MAFLIAILGATALHDHAHAARPTVRPHWDNPDGATRPRSRESTPATLREMRGSTSAIEESTARCADGPGRSATRPQLATAGGGGFGTDKVNHTYKGEGRAGRRGRVVLVVGM